jgi:hypothetical protein
MVVKPFVNTEKQASPDSNGILYVFLEKYKIEIIAEIAK